MSRFVEGENRAHSTLFPEKLDDYITDDNPVRSWMGSTHFMTQTLPRVSTEMSLHVLAYNLKRAMKLFGAQPLMEMMRVLPRVES